MFAVVVADACFALVSSARVVVVTRVVAVTLAHVTVVAQHVPARPCVADVGRAILGVVTVPVGAASHVDRVDLPVTPLHHIVHTLAVYARVLGTLIAVIAASGTRGRGPAVGDRGVDTAEQLVTPV